jgi:hypothetical protein
MDRPGDLIAVRGNLYEYAGIEQTIGGIMHKAHEVHIDDDGVLTITKETWHLTERELDCRGIDLTERQWIGLVEHFLRKEYSLTDDEIKAAANDIVCRCFNDTRIPLVEELPNYIAIYIGRS